MAISQNILHLDGSEIKSIDLDRKIEELTENAKITGLAVSIFNDNKVVYKKTFGFKNAVTREPIKGSTNIYGASFSKAVFAVMVMKLVKDGQLDLDKPLQDYLSKPIYEYPKKTKWHDNYEDLRNDTLYQKITARMCLDHTTGFPNWRWDNSDEKLRINTEPGARYSYSGEGMVYLQVVLEHMTGKSLEEMMHEIIFSPLGMKNSSYTWQPEFEKDYCLGHNSSGELYEKDKDNEARSASTLETTFDDYTTFTEAVLNNQILDQATTKKMFTQQIKIRSIAQFGPMRLKDADFNDGINLGYGLGWVLLKSQYGTGAFKEGHGDGFQHYTILFPDAKTGIVIMSNSDNAESIFKELLETAIGDKFTPWRWENYVPYNMKEEK